MMFLPFLIVISILSSSIIYADELGCCTNPGVGAKLCYDLALIFKDAECCPTQSTNPSYYQSTSNPSGPTDYSDCTTNYFQASTSCSLVDDCQTGCCCGDSLAGVKTNAECQGTGLTFHEGETDCNTICTVSECNDGTNNDPTNNDCADYPIDTGCTSLTDTDESGGTCDIALKCSDPNYIPTLEILTINPPKGEKKFELTWSDECFVSILYYEISRCKGTSCSDFVLLSTSTQESFTDDSSDLLFDTNYSYQVKSHYSAITTTPSLEGKNSLGNLECWYQTDYTQFCIHPFYYDKYQNYLVTNSNDFTQANFDTEVSSKFSSKFNEPYYCNDGNILTSSGSKCTGTDICIVESNTPQCIGQSECSYASANPLGLYYEKTSCETDMYCFYDKSFTITDNCYACSVDMDCYDYKSQSSCETDNCKMGSCEWNDLSSELGTGVCISNVKYNCEWCDETGTAESSVASNNIFESCTEEKTQELSITNFICYFKDGKAKNCQDVVCTDYDVGDCSSTQITLDDTNTISNPGSDTCGLGVCQLFSDECKKNTDGNNEADCTDEACEQDYFKPDTTLTPVIDNGVYTNLNIQILDKTSSGSYETIVTTKDYKTYLCKGCSGSHPFSNSYTLSQQLIVTGLSVYDGDNGSLLLTLDEGNNTIRYYSEDPSKNVGIIKEVSVNAFASINPPVVFSVDVAGATQIGDVYYTSSLSTITAQFVESAYITSAELANDVTTGKTIPSFSSTLLDTFDFSFSGLTDGNYTFTFNAKNSNGFNMANPYSIKIVLDSQPLTLSIKPQAGTTIIEGYSTVNLTFNKKINILEVLINSENFTSEFTTTNNSFYTASLNLTDGSKAMTVYAKDYAGNTISETRNFEVNIIPTNITLLYPSNGVSPTYTFNITINTDDNANCKYSFNDVLEYNFMTAFTVTGGIEHRISSFNQIPDPSTSEYNFYVKCNDSVHDLESKTFKLRVDTTLPIISAAYAYPNPVIEAPTETTLKIQTDEGVSCKYSETETNYDLMNGEFPDFKTTFRTINTKNISLSGSDKFTFYVGCENEAELKSEVKSINVSINLTASLEVISHTSQYSNASTINLAVETNKQSQCKYSSSDSTVTSGNIFGASGYSHVKSLSLSPGSYTYYVTCKDSSMTDWSDVLSISFTIDNTVPIMLYVNDSSSLSNPEITWREDKLRVNWLGTDNGTSIHHYLYSLEEFATLKTIVNWTTESEGGKWIWIRNLNLSDGVKYYFKVKVKNIVGLISNIMESDGITLDVTAKPASCTNNIKDTDESDIDCGGSCPSCADNKNCTGDIDCQSGYCNEINICKTPTCTDNTKNQDETSTDCGGITCSTCADGKSCNSNDDCTSDYCAFGACKTEECYDGKLSGSESDVDCGGACPNKCGVYKHCEFNEDCISGANCIGTMCKVCVAGDADCDGTTDTQGNDLDGDGMDDTWEINNGLDPNDSSDASSDEDKDGLTAYEEYSYRTNPNLADTDGDNYDDYIEIVKETDPLDKDSKPKSNFWLILLIPLLGLIIGLVVFVAYHKIALNRKIVMKPSKPLPQFTHQPITPVRRSPMPENMRQMRLKRGEEKLEKRNKVFDAFGGEKKEETKTKETRPANVVEKKQVEEKNPKETEKKIRPEVFLELSELAEKPKKKPEGDPFVRLAQLAGEHKQVTKSQIKKPLAKTRKPKLKIPKTKKSSLKNALSKKDVGELRKKYPRTAQLLLDKKYPEKQIKKAERKQKIKNEKKQKKK